MIMAIQDDTIMLHDDADEWLEIGLIGGRGAVRMVHLQELPRRVGFGERVCEEVGLDVGVVVTR